MAEDSRGRGLPSRDLLEESQYPPPPGEEDDRSRGPYRLPPPLSAGMTLPSIQDPYRGPTGRGYPPPPDPTTRGTYSASPTNANGYPSYLPPVQAPQDQRASYGQEYYGTQRGGYPADPYQQYPPYRQSSGAPYGYPGPSVPTQQQAAPRQRTSIACRYCRKRKIRCSGYQNTPDGKCTNCKKTGNDCIFQPVSSSSSTAFIPVSAVPGGVPPGTPLYGAFGQPLTPSVGGQTPPQGAYTMNPAEYQTQLPSPTTQYYGQGDERGEASRRRPRGPDDEPGMRLPPPNPGYQEETDPRRRSPASTQGSTPPMTYHQQYRGGEYETTRTPTPQRNSPGGQQPPPPGASGSSSIMSLGNLMDHPPSRPAGDIDQNMLGRLNRRS